MKLLIPMEVYEYEECRAFWRLNTKDGTVP